MWELNPVHTGMLKEAADYNEPRTRTVLLQGIRTGRPAGSEQFVEMIERLTGDVWRCEKRGCSLKRA